MSQPPPERTRFADPTPLPGLDHRDAPAVEAEPTGAVQGTTGPAAAEPASQPPEQVALEPDGAEAESAAQEPTRHDGAEQFPASQPTAAEAASLTIPPGSPPVVLGTSHDEAVAPPSSGVAPEPPPATDNPPATPLLPADRVPADPVDVEPAAVPMPRRSRAVPVLASLAAVLVALTALLGVLVVRSSGSGQVATSRTQALAAARAQSRVVFSYDYRHLAKDFAAGKAATTGAFRDEYVRTTGKLVTDVAPRYKAVVVADVSDAAVVSATESAVVALVFVNQQSSSTLVPTPKVTQSRLEMTLVHRGGQWLVSKVRAL